MRRSTRNTSSKLHRYAQKGETDKLMKIIASLKKSGQTDTLNKTNESHRQTPLHIAISNGHESIAKALLSEIEVKVNLFDSGQKTPLMFAAIRGMPDITAMILRRNGDPNLRDRQGNTALHYAIDNRRADLVKILLGSTNTRIAIKDGSGRTPYDVARAANNYEILELLYQRDPGLRHGMYNETVIGTPDLRSRTASRFTLASNWSESNMNRDFEVNEQSPDTMSISTLKTEIARDSYISRDVSPERPKPQPRTFNRPSAYDNQPATLVMTETDTSQSSTSSRITTPTKTTNNPISGDYRFDTTTSSTAYQTPHQPYSSGRPASSKKPPLSARQRTFSPIDKPILKHKSETRSENSSSDKSSSVGMPDVPLLQRRNRELEGLLEAKTKHNLNLERENNELRRQLERIQERDERNGGPAANLRHTSSEVHALMERLQMALSSASASIAGEGNNLSELMNSLPK